MAELTTYTRGELEEARHTVARCVMLDYGDLCGTALVSVEVTDQEAARYLAGATIEELLNG